MAVILILSMVGATFGLISWLSDFDGSEGNGDMKELLENIGSNDITALYIDIGTSALEIKTGDKWSVCTDNKYIKVKVSDGALRLTEEDHFTWFSISHDDTKVILSIPQGTELEKASIYTGAGLINIEFLIARDAEFDFGAGEVKLDGIKAEHAKLDGGAGKITVTGSRFSKLDLNMGVGALSLEAQLSSGSEIDCGVGRVELRLLGAPSDYRIKVAKALGSIDIDERLEESGGVYGSGANEIKINGGIGSVDVELAD